MAQLAKENAGKPITTTTWCAATRINNTWQFGPKVKNRALVAKVVKMLQCTTALAAKQTAEGNPPAVLIEITSTTTTTATPATITTEGSAK
jgi:hypothetical protein